MGNKGRRGTGSTQEIRKKREIRVEKKRVPLFASNERK